MSPLRISGILLLCLFLGSFYRSVLVHAVLSFEEDMKLVSVAARSKCILVGTVFCSEEVAETTFAIVPVG